MQEAFSLRGISVQDFSSFKTLEAYKVEKFARQPYQPRVVVQFATRTALVIPSQLYRRGICLLPAAKKQIPRAIMPRFGMTNAFGDFKLHHYPARRIAGDLAAGYTMALILGQRDVIPDSCIGCGHWKTALDRRSLLL